MSKDWIIDDAYFGKIKKLPWRGDVIKQFINICIDHKEDDVIEFIDYIYNSGYSIVNQILPIHNLVLNSNKLSSDMKSKIIITLANIDQNLIKGCDEYIQLYRLAYFIMSLKKSKKKSSSKKRLKKIMI